MFNVAFLHICNSPLSDEQSDLSLVCSFFYKMTSKSNQVETELKRISREFQLVAEYVQRMHDEAEAEDQEIERILDETTERQQELLEKYSLKPMSILVIVVAAAAVFYRFT